MRPKHFVAMFFVLALSAAASPAHAGGVVTVCDEAHLRTALAGGGSVTFACSGTITLAARITIAVSTTIDGSGQNVTLSGNHAVSVFYVNSGIALNLHALTIADGSADGSGGGIYNDGGIVTLSESTLSGNNAGGSGGAISNAGTVTVSNSTFAGNSSGGGGAISNGYYSTLTVGNSTFSGNSTGGSGGAISNNSINVVTVSNSTFFGNSAEGSGGAIWNGYNRVLTVSNSTFSGNSSPYGGSMYNNGMRMAFKNTIVANSLGSSNCEGAITDGRGNLSYPDATCPGVVGNPALGPLQNNGGQTLTMALSAGSAAIDTADDTICAAAPVNNLDQRGLPRPQGTHCDIGAFEAVQGVTATPTATPTPAVTPTPTSTPTAAPAAHAIYLPMIVR